MIHKQRYLSVQAFALALIYIVGFSVLLVYMQPLSDQALSHHERLLFILSNQSLYQYWMLVIYVVFGCVLVPFASGIKHYMASNGRRTTWLNASCVFAYIWSGLVIASGMIAVVGIEAISTMYSIESTPEHSHQINTIWIVLSLLQDSLGGGVEVVGGLWVITLAIYSIKERLFYSVFNVLGVLVGACGVLTVIPELSDLGGIFGLAQIIWFLLLSVFFIKNTPAKDTYHEKN